MARNKYEFTEAKYLKWTREGRGAGHGSTYKPWLTVRDVPSKGRSHRVFGHTSKRIHHLLSDLELAVFLILEWNDCTKDIREQFPLRREDTLEIAKEAGISHPADKDVQLVMSSDFLVDTSDKTLPKFTLQAKYSTDLQEPRTIEKLEIERRYWKLKEIPWKLITECDIPKVVFQNVGWLYPAQQNDLSEGKMVELVEFYTGLMGRFPNKTIVDICKHIDSSYKLELGESLLEFRQLLAKRCFTFDITKPIQMLRASELKLEEQLVLSEVLDVSN